MAQKFTICVLLYGDYPQLASRCLESLRKHILPEDRNVRVGLNAVSAATRQVVMDFGLPEECLWESDTNIYKYPMMRQMVHGRLPVTTDYLMWFDDDSCISGLEQSDLEKLAAADRERPSTVASDWLRLVDHAMVDADMIGSIYWMNWQGRQRDWVRDQPWYNGASLEGPRVKFATGGWWTIRAELLRRFDYPWPELEHRGGDMLLGELFRQQDLRLRQFRSGLWINADVFGFESKSPRRGFDQPVLGANYRPGNRRAADIP